MSPRRFDAVLFDLDGTLIDSAADIAAAVNHVRSGMGLAPLESDVVRRYIGDGVRVLLERSLTTQDPTILDRALGRWREHYGEHCLDRTILYDGIVQVLELLSSRKVTMSVVSNKPAAFSERILRGLGVRAFFTVVVGGDTVATRKPDPAPLQWATRKMRLHSKRVLVVGDSPIDIQAAKRAGYTSCGVLWGLVDAMVIRASKPDFLAERPSDVQRIVIGDE